MPSELIVVTCDAPEEAEHVLDALESMRRNRILALDNVALVSKTDPEEIRLRHEQELALGAENAAQPLCFGQEIVIGER